MTDSYSDAELDAFLDESLSAELMSAIEKELRDHEPLRNRLVKIIERRDQGSHTVGAIWRRHRLSCPTREQLGSYLLEAVDEDLGKYIEFHLQTVGCRYCQAGVVDLKRRQSEAQDQTQTRRKRYFESSAGYLPPS